MSDRANITLLEFKEKVKETLTLFNELPEEQKQEALYFWSDIISQVEKYLTDQGQVKTDVLLAPTKEVKEKGKGKAKRRRGLKWHKLKRVNNEADLSITSVAEAEAVSGLLEIQNKSESQNANGQEIIRDENIQIIHLNSNGKGSEVKVESLAPELLNATSNQLEEFAIVATPDPVYIYPGLSPLKYDTPLASYGSEEVVHIQIEKTDGKIQNYVVKPVKNAGNGKQLDLLEEDTEIAEDHGSDEVENEEDSEVYSENEENSSHQTQHQKQKSSYLKCKKCFKLLSSSSALNIHLRSHSGDRPFACSLCHKTFSTKGNMQRHERSHQGQKPYKCTECDSRFTENKSLKVHMRRHTGERPFKCPHCPKSFMQSGTLQSHLLVHSGQKSHLCDTCGQAFRQKSQLKVHQKRHFDIREFKCDICTYQSISKGDLERHKLRHTGEKPFLCELCPKRFTRQQYLKEHMNVHKGTNPYKCDRCEFATSKMALLYRHKRRHMVEEVKAAKQKSSGPFQQYPNNENGETYPDDIYEQDESQLENSLDPVVVHETNNHVEHATGNAGSLQGIKVVQITFVHSEQNEQGEITEDDEGATPAVVQITQELPAQKVDLAAVKLPANATVGEYFIENS